MPETVSLHRYRDGIMIEVISDDGNGNVSTRSVEFDVVDPERGALAPRSEIPDAHEERILERLEASEYALARPVS